MRTGKAHLATALGVQAIEHHHRRVLFFPMVELVNALELEKVQARRADRAPAGVCRHGDLDELGYLPFSASGGAPLFHLLSNLCDGIA